MDGKIMVMGGETDTGKSLQSLMFEGDKRIIDTENRVQNTVNYHTKEQFLPDEMRDKLISFNIDVRNVVKLHDKTDKTKGIMKYQPDYLASYYALRDEIETALEETDQYDVLIIDSISPIRKQYCLYKWHEENPNRVQPQPVEWGRINQLARDVLEPIIHMARCEDKTVIFTVQKTDEYVNDKLNGRIMDSKDWCSYNMDLILEMYQPTIRNGREKLDKFNVLCHKSLVGRWDSEVTYKPIEDTLIENGL